MNCITRDDSRERTTFTFGTFQNKSGLNQVRSVEFASFLISIGVIRRSFSCSAEDSEGSDVMFRIVKSSGMKGFGSGR
jgi:hypothetical protein